MPKKQVRVAVGVILEGDRVFISLRETRLHQGGKWEFPGGKCEENETPAQALVRELHEETGIKVNTAVPFMQIEHDYGDKAVCLEVFLVRDFSDQPHGREGQQSQWVPLTSLPEYPFPQANKAIIEKLLGKK
ncbi:8-oxo-dGTP diphosphatase MutT [Lacimicrobium alkaliphilum]|uniref:8-oxo-dGTP diphosphatase n=1 Tax=Lacimicrobium alkaliphilum TaxID=1526571 RepID=A0ABQ1QXH3_9ALTE|nr:8-oxo-dGTP diphosphatase MutT [Lacimicrobium alkaliphilum]GGD50875.1 7,8-dihydro-8-oxoguanine-triphosphatase [Lacimicrobium alkaliphilum]